jgi:outer membrane protein insertion porin family/translocation and assembly module TamA
LAQLRCADTPNDTLIRKVSFEGNATFSDEELAYHVVSTPTDWSRRNVFGNKKLVIGSFGAAGLLVGLTASEIKPLNVGLWTATGFALGYGISRISGIARCLGRGTLAGDIQNLSGFYRDQGFKDVRVDTATRVDGHRVDVIFRVTEGQPVLVDSLRIIGFDTTALGPLPASLNSRKGGRYSPTLTQEDLDTLETRLRDNGYPEGRVDRDVELAQPGYRAKVQFTVTPGIKARFGQIRINHTALQGRDTSIETGVILSLLRFRTGDLFSERVLYDAGRRFYSAGTFVTAEVAPDMRRLATDSVVDVIVNVVEDLMHSGSVEPAVGTLDCLRMRGTYADKGFLGGVNRLDVSGSVSKIGLAAGTRWKLLEDACRKFPYAPDTTEISASQLNYNATVRLTRPLPLPGGLLPSVSAYTERRGGYKAYLRTTVVGGAVTLSKAITRTVVFEGSYNLEYGHTEAAATVLCFLFRACDKSAQDQLTGDNKRLAVVGAKFSRDRRNNTDSASSGTLARLDLRLANRWLLSDTTIEFRKGTIDLAWYRRLGLGVVALRARAGVIGGGQQTGGGRLAPPQERLYVGGETSVRGFRQNELGPLIYVTSDTGVTAVLNATTDPERIAALQKLDMRIIPAGGTAMYVGNLEYRLPGPFLKSIQTVLFVDAGALSTTGLTTITGSNQFRFTPGVALKYFSPVGPVQINLGYNSYDLLDGPAYSDQFTNTQGPILQCLTGEQNGVCRPLPAIAPLPQRWYRRLTLSVAFPPDF